ncbi:MAG: C25 family cysteine peptidase [Methanobacteriota archaeon]
MRRYTPPKLLIVLLILLLILPQITREGNAEPEQQTTSYTMSLQQQQNQITIGYQITAFSTTTIHINGNEYSQLLLDGATETLTTGLPNLPHITRSILIPDNTPMNAQITHTEYNTYEEISIPPSKGNIPRTINPSTVPYEFNLIYTQDTWYPENILDISEPYSIRDFDGQTIHLTPFQYNPIQKQLRFYTEITVDLTPRTTPPQNNYPQQNQPIAADTDFITIYEHQFLNFNTLYTPLEEHGKMLVITSSAFWSTMIPFVQWKNQKGIQTEMINVSEIGGTAEAIRDFIAQYYHNHGLTYVLLVGDASQVPTITANGASSDPSYTYIVGDDHYPDIFIGRFSAETIADTQTQVERTLDYEKTPQIGATWYQKGTGIGSNQGPGDDNEYDWQHIRNIRTDLLNYFYSAVDEFYDGSHGGNDAEGNPTSGMIATAVNEGRGIINYCGHGTQTSWSTSGFNTGSISGLTNDHMLPFIFSVACLNGKFETGTCFAEAWLRATHNNEPSGAIATFMSSRSQTWNPPMDAQDEMIDLLVESYGENTRNTFGSLAFYGCMHMNDQYGSAGFIETDAWHVFGDPSLAVRTAPPEVLTVSHESTISAGATTFEVHVPGVKDALCALSRDFVLLGVGYTDVTGVATIQLFHPLSGAEDVDLVVTAYNRIPYQDSLVVTGGGQPMTPEPPSGPNEGDVNQAIVFQIPAVTDPEQQDVFYYVDWGDGLNTNWIGPYHSGEGPIEVRHHWTQPGYYEIKIKAKDIFDLESPYSEPFLLNIGQRLEILSITGGLGITATIQNTLPASKYVEYSLEIIGGSLPGFHVNKYMNGTIFLSTGTSEQIHTKPFFALGRTKIVLTIKSADKLLTTKTIEGFTLFFYIHLN